jgi:hypothetical protein
MDGVKTTIDDGGEEKKGERGGNTNSEAEWAISLVTLSLHIPETARNYTYQSDSDGY